MARVGRNEPCPCGSGKKYKQCCMHADVNPELLMDARARQIHEIDYRMTGELVRFALRRFGETWFDDARTEYLPDEFHGNARLEAPLFVPWALHHARSKGRTVAECFFENPTRPVGTTEREWSEAEGKAWLSIWELTRVERNRGMHATDLITGERRFVSEVLATQMLVERDCLLGRVTDYPGFSIFSGVHTMALPPREADALVRYFRSLLGRKVKPIPVESLREAKTMLILADLWRDRLEAMDSDSQAPREMVNTDGDPILLTTDTFAFAPAIREHILASISALAETSAGGQEDGETFIRFLRDANPMHSTWENTVIGQATVGVDTLTLETNSIKRADDLRVRVQEVCPQLTASPLRGHEDPRGSLRLATPGSQNAFLKQTPKESRPEFQAVVKAYKTREYSAWSDTALPALNGLTPREASKRSKPRHALDVLLKELENREARTPEAERFDVAVLRTELGM